MRTSLPKIHFDTNSIRKFEYSIYKEWIITNGLGGYASSTILGLNTRKYHGLLIAAFNPPVNRHVLLEKLDEEIVFEDKILPLYSNEFRHGIIPEGFSFLQDFYLNPFPTYRYNVEGIEVLKRVFMPYKKNAIMIFYEVFNPHFQPITLKIYPCINARHFHKVSPQREKLGWSFVQASFSNGAFLKIEHPQVFIALGSRQSRYVPAEKWIEEVFYRIDASRGESSLDDYYQPGRFHFEIAANTRKKFCVLAVGASNEDRVKKDFLELNKGIENAEKLMQNEINRLNQFLDSFYAFQSGVEAHEWLSWLVLTADSFVVYRKSVNGSSVIAGYHWFEDWGRDSLISLPGLTLVTGRFEAAKKILRTFKYYCQNGIIPNRFPDKTGNKPVYNTVDATLWFFNAVLQFLKYTGDFKFVKQELWSTLKEIIDYHVNGTIYGIKVDDGLLAHGPQLTWMDAVVEGKAVTPRSGRAVEIQALWYNALKNMEMLASNFEEKAEAEKYAVMAEKTKRSFLEKFWNPKAGCLFDVVHDDGSVDNSLRPNQIIAVALDFSMLDEEKSEKVVNTVWKKLLTPYGLRTLSRDDRHYRGKYAGDWNERNLAYHNGTAWPWLLGPFTTAFLKVKNYEEKWRAFVFENFLKELFSKQIFEAGLGTISEIFDGDPPHVPRGCISQAWSVAEPLRVYIEDVLFKRPPFERQILNVHPRIRSFDLV